MRGTPFAARALLSHAVACVGVQLSNDLVNVLNISVGTTVAILLRVALMGRD